ncbi:class I SAM-dependent methyltransferase [Guptibacillus sedimenti]|uniref:class I SAM-dependent methyltransferase n=1 Tax=Guptibacillus sedimenti TaxID=3025680 RepID=UPI002362698F|nr:class I SAM-dependent methyltransferase [Pseudalkalibacillus sedimenti]
MEKVIRNEEDLLQLLDQLLEEEKPINWDAFYSDRKREVPFFVHLPDENLVRYFQSESFKPRKVLELGCGHGRNAIYLAEKGCKVDAVDASKEALNWARDEAHKRQVNINFIEKNLYYLSLTPHTYDFVYDSGCFHHIAPHRRMSYIALVKRSLKEEGEFALTCFIENGELGGSSLSDLEVYQKRSLQEGLGFTEEKLIAIFQQDFEPVEVTEMKQRDSESGTFGVSGLLTARFRLRSR